MGRTSPWCQTCTTAPTPAVQRGGKALQPGSRNSWFCSQYSLKRGMIWFIQATVPLPVTYLPQRSAFIFKMCLQSYRIQPTHNLKVWQCWGGESPRTAYLTFYQKLPETCSISFPQTPTSPTLLPPKGLQQRGPSLPAATAWCDHGHFSQAGKGWWNKTRAGGWSLRKFTFCLNPRMPSTASQNRKPKDVSRVTRL